MGNSYKWSKHKINFSLVKKKKIQVISFLNFQELYAPYCNLWEPIVWTQEYDISLLKIEFNCTSTLIFSEQMTRDKFAMEGYWGLSASMINKHIHSIIKYTIHTEIYN